MQIEGTREAFSTLIGNHGIYKRLGVDTATVSEWKNHLRQGKSISLDKMEEMLEKSGATVIQEKVWMIRETMADQSSVNSTPIVPKELRVGNYISDRTNDASFVTVTVQLMMTLNHFEVSNYQPILLNEEWLRKFKLDNQAGTVSDLWHTGSNPVTKKWLFEIIHNKDEHRFFYRNGYHKIKYVHQLQNLYFALTGTDLALTTSILKNL